MKLRNIPAWLTFKLSEVPFQHINPQRSSHTHTLQLLQSEPWAQSQSLPPQQPHQELPPHSPGVPAPLRSCWDFPPNPAQSCSFIALTVARLLLSLLCSSSSEQQCRSQFELKRLLGAQGRVGGLRLPWSGELGLIGTLRTYKTCKG